MIADDEMPYIAIKAFPKDEKTKKEVVEKINQIFLEIWKCPQEAITISLEEFIPDEWDEKVKNKEIITKKDSMMILDGKKIY